MMISILGCGWLGLPLAEHLIQRGHSVKGSTTTKSKIDVLKNHSVEPFLLNFNPALETEQDVSDFWNANVLVLNIPPGRRRENVIKFHTNQIKNIVDEIHGSSIKHVVFVSSTSVYPKYGGAMREEDAVVGQATRNSGEALIETEDFLMRSSNFNTTVLRFGGLIGGDRHPAKYMSGRKKLGKANAPVNLIHRDDCIRIITKIIEENVTGEIFNAVTDHHPTRKEYYTKAAEKLDLELPQFREEKTSKNYKKVSNKKLKKQLNYTFIHSNLFEIL